MKFVSHGTVSAIKNADEGMSRGGERKRVSVLFSDIRGYTEFAERVSPEVVIEALNQYFEAQTAIVETHNGDVDKFIGDALVAVFEGDDMERRGLPVRSRSSTLWPNCWRGFLNTICMLASVLHQAKSSWARWAPRAGWIIPCLARP